MCFVDKGSIYNLLILISEYVIYFQCSVFTLSFHVVHFRKLLDINLCQGCECFQVSVTVNVCFGIQMWIIKFQYKQI